MISALFEVILWFRDCLFEALNKVYGATNSSVVVLNPFLKHPADKTPEDRAAKVCLLANERWSLLIAQV